MVKKPDIPTGCLYQANYDEGLAALRRECTELCYRYNQLSPNDRKARLAILRELLGAMDESTEVTPPFWCDYGCNIRLGRSFYSNHNLVILDGAEVRFGDSVFVAPNCCFTTAEHAIDPEQRREGLTIGDNSVIGAGSVVTHDIPANVVAVGTPCRVLREITEQDKLRYPMYGG